MRNLIEDGVFGIELVKSGRLCLNLNSCIDWDQFPQYAENLARALGAEIKKMTDSFDVRVWELSIQGESILLVFDDYPVMVSLESTSEAGDSILVEINSQLEAEADKERGGFNSRSACRRPK